MISLNETTTSRLLTNAIPQWPLEITGMGIVLYRSPLPGEPVCYPSLCYRYDHKLKAFLPEMADSRRSIPAGLADDFPSLARFLLIGGVLSKDVAFEASVIGPVFSKGHIAAWGGIESANALLAFSSPGGLLANINMREIAPDATLEYMIQSKLPNREISLWEKLLHPIRY